MDTFVLTRTPPSKIKNFCYPPRLLPVRGKGSLTQSHAYCIARQHLTYTRPLKKARLSPGALHTSDYPAALRATSSGAPWYPSSADSSFEARITACPTPGIRSLVM